MLKNIARILKPNITTRISLAMSSLIVITAVIFSFLFITQQRELIRKELKDRGVELGDGLAYNSEYGVLTENKELLSTLAKGVLKNRDVVYCIIQNHTGEILAHEDTLNPENNPPINIHFAGEGMNTEAVFKSALSSRSSIIKLGKLYVGENGREAVRIVEGYNIASPVKTKKIVQKGEEIAMSSGGLPETEESIGVVQIGLSLEGANNLIRIMTFVVIIITSLIVLSGIGYSIVATRIIVKPINELVVGTRKVATGDLTYKVKIDTEDEIGELAVSFNQMTDDLALFRDRIEQRRHELEDKNKELESAYDELKKVADELRLAQSQLVQSEKMTAIGQLGAGVAHELNNPLGGILGYSQFMLEKMARPEFSKEDFLTCKKYLTHIERESARCKTIVENLLSFSRKTHDVVEVDLRNAIDRTLSIVGHQLALANIKVSMEIDPDISNISGNINMLQQIFVNLIINAQHAMPNGGDLKISLKNIKDQSGKVKSVEVKVGDTGSGIAPENLSKIFDPFFTTKQDWKGTGLGLFITYKIIKDHNGEISVQSEVGKGTVFNMKFPAFQREHIIHTA